MNIFMLLYDRLCKYGVSVLRKISEWQSVACDIGFRGVSHAGTVTDCMEEE